MLLFLLLLNPSSSLSIHPEARPFASSEETEREHPRSRPAQETGDLHALLFRANQAYLEGRYDEAAHLYDLLVGRGHLNGHVFFNLGNTHIRLGELGKAILNYRKACVLLPRDGDLKANLRYARSLTKDRIEEDAPSLWHTLAFWYFGMSFGELLITFVVLHTLFWGSALLHLYRESEWIKWSLWLSLLLSIVVGISAGWKYRESFQNAGGVVLAEETPIRAGFSRNDTTLFILHEGAEFTILDEENGWWKIALADGKKGWLVSQVAGRVALGSDQSIAR